jgi:hypothetical protein
MAAEIWISHRESFFAQFGFNHSLVDALQHNGDW